MKPILQPGRNCGGLQEVHDTGLLIDCRDYYRAFYHAAKAAQRFILIAGWQFDSTVRLLRGEDVKEAEGEVRFLPFLNELCEQNPELRIYILAWDFNPIFALEREWRQERVFNATTNERLQFRFDSRHPIGASHHQKFVVIDSQFAFIGGADLCANRWDDRRHRAEHSERREDDAKPYGPYHEVHSYHSGPIARQLTELFILRWRQSGCDSITLPSPPPLPQVVLEPSADIIATEAALSRTQPSLLAPPRPAIQEICQLYLTAIAAAEETIYIETQYFSSRAICWALAKRMRDARRSRLQIVLILPKRPEALTEEFALGFSQTKLLRELQKTARETGHAFGVYYTAALGADGREYPTYIHSKLLVVDDRFLSIGSANATNRSMGFDTELNVSWEASSFSQRDLVRSIHHVRMSLLAEHTGVGIEQAELELGRATGLVDYLNNLTYKPCSRLRRHTMDTSFVGRAWTWFFKPEGSWLDPERPLLPERLQRLMT